MSPWQQVKITALTVASLLRGQAIAPKVYRPVDTAVGRSQEDFLNPGTVEVEMTPRGRTPAVDLQPDKREKSAMTRA